MELSRHVRKIESFLCSDRNIWSQYSMFFLSSTQSVFKTGSRSGNPFQNCNSEHEFCNACHLVADKICSQALFIFNFSLKEFIADYHNNISESPETTAQSMSETLEISKPIFIENIIKLIFNMETVFQLYYYTELIRKIQDIDAKKKFAEILHQEQQNHQTIELILSEYGKTEKTESDKIERDTKIRTTYANNMFSISKDITFFNSLSAFSSRYGGIQEESIKIFIDTCIFQQWSMIQDREAADSVMCRILEKTLSELTPIPFPINTTLGTKLNPQYLQTPLTGNRQMQNTGLNGELVSERISSACSAAFRIFIAYPLKKIYKLVHEEEYKPFVPRYPVMNWKNPNT